MTETSTKEEQKENIEQDQELNENDKACVQIINSNDYYEILNLNENAEEEEIKKSYRKIIVKFHPDKNKSKYSADAFKKLSQAYQILSDKEKRAFYDEYGTEEEFMSKTQGKQFNTMNEHDLYDLILNNRRRGNQNPNEERKNKLFQILNLVFSCYMFYWMTSSGNSEKPSNTQTSYFRFEKSDYFNLEGTTIPNKVNFYYSKELQEKIDTIPDEEIVLFYGVIEKHYLSYLSGNCNGALKRKYDIEHRLATTHHSSESLEEELENIDFSYCDQYEEYKEIIE
mmetsp:Transcript_35402/g.36793  ORF Transcript_35402/g.36793 Transcript_35402/m.36793 type:complete len:283 (+) Transcript_35402:23-871(+)